MFVSCIILAGGLSRRMGTDKRRLRLWGEGGPMLLEHAVIRVARISDDIIVALNDPEAWSGLPARLVRDLVDQSGPLAGLAAGLAMCRYDYALTLACDLPLVQDALIDALLMCPRPYDALVPLRPDVDARAPRNPLAVEPLLAIYRRTCLAAIDDCLKRGARAMSALLELVDTRYLPPEIWRRCDPHGVSFININSPDDVERVAKIISGGVHC
ncbi:MAG: molybdenum cofactor guanylyltransferase [Roseiflexus sp.]